MKDNGAMSYTEAANYTTEEQLKKEEIYLDLSKLSEEEIKEIYKKIKNSDQNIHTQTERDLINGIVTHCYWFLFFDGNAWNQNETPLSGRTELTYPEFIKLFEGGKSKEVLQVENTVFNIDFGGHVMAGLKIVNGEIEVVGAMNGYGNGISADKIIIIKSNQ